MNNCTENLYEKCDGTNPAELTFDHYGIPTAMCEDCYEWLHGRLEPLKRG